MKPLLSLADPWKGVVVACASVTACAAALGFDASPQLLPYNYIADTSGGHWQESDLEDSQFAGGVFDGRYVYLVPALTAAKGAAVLRYDSHAAFAVTSWARFSVSHVGSAADTIFGGGVFDGRYVYLIPARLLTAKHPADSILVRYDTTAPYESNSSWEAFDVTQNVEHHPNGFNGGTFDGRYVYLAPFPEAHAARFDTRGTLSSGSSWETFDMRELRPRASGAVGAIFDGRFVYFVPFANSKLARYDTRKSFTDATGWETVNLVDPGFNPDTGGFTGGAFDGRYVYFAPYTSFLGTVARFDTTAPGGLAATASWSFFSVQQNVNKNGDGFRGAAFDGRFVYFVPDLNVQPDGLVVRVDSLGDFQDKRSWSTFDMTAVSPGAVLFWGAVFDGQFLYFVPNENAVITRFEARTSPEMPKLPGFFGSFF